MNTTELRPSSSDVQQVLASAFAHRIERMSKVELQELVTQAQLAIRKDNVALQQRVKQLEEEAAQHRLAIAELEADKARLYCQISRSQLSEKDWEGFDPTAFTVPAETMLANARKRLQQS